MISPDIQIAIFSKGRSHLWDMAFSMDQLGANVSFYTDVPLFRLKQFGYSNQNVSSFFSACFPFVLASKTKLGNKENQRLNQLWINRLDEVASKALNPCDIFIGLSGLSIKSSRTAKNKYGAQVWIERGSVHILTQKRILDQIVSDNKTERIPDWAIDRELETYEIADHIVVPSLHVAQSFYEHGISADRIFLNNYGVNLNDFPITQSPENSSPTLIYVGTWSYQKGCDLINNLLEDNSSLKLFHVGSAGDCPFPKTSNFKTFGAVNQKDLSHYYSKGHLLIHLSRQEGQSLVLAQALASGLPIVCSPNSGGKDLQIKLSSDPAVKVLATLDPTEINTAVLEQLRFATNQPKSRNSLGARRNLLSWEASAQSYLEEIAKCLSASKPPISATGSGK